MFITTFILLCHFYVFLQVLFSLQKQDIAFMKITFLIIISTYLFFNITYFPMYYFRVMTPLLDLLESMQTFDTVTILFFSDSLHKHHQKRKDQLTSQQVSGGKKTSTIQQLRDKCKLRFLSHRFRVYTCQKSVPTQITLMLFYFL